MEEVTDESAAAAAAVPSLSPEQLRILIFEAINLIESIKSLQILESLIKAMPKK